MINLIELFYILMELLSPSKFKVKICESRIRNFFHSRDGELQVTPSEVIVQQHGRKTVIAISSIEGIKVSLESQFMMIEGAQQASFESSQIFKIVKAIVETSCQQSFLISFFQQSGTKIIKKENSLEARKVITLNRQSLGRDLANLMLNLRETKGQRIIQVDHPQLIFEPSMQDFKRCQIQGRNLNLYRHSEGQIFIIQSLPLNDNNNKAELLAYLKNYLHHPALQRICMVSQRGHTLSLVLKHVHCYSMLDKLKSGLSLEQRLVRHLIKMILSQISDRQLNQIKFYLAPQIIGFSDDSYFFKKSQALFRGGKVSNQLLPFNHNSLQLGLLMYQLIYGVPPTLSSDKQFIGRLLKKELIKFPRGVSFDGQQMMRWLFYGNEQISLSILKGMPWLEQLQLD